MLEIEEMFVWHPVNCNNIFYSNFKKKSQKCEKTNFLNETFWDSSREGGRGPLHKIRRNLTPKLLTLVEL